MGANFRSILLRDIFLVYLKDVNHHPTRRREFLMTDVTFEMLRFLMLNQDLFVVKLSFAVPFVFVFVTNN